MLHKELRNNIRLTSNIQNYFWVYLVLLFNLFSATTLSQWNDNPSLNVNLIIDAVNPTNINAYENPNGGAFIFWEDNKGKGNNVYFQFIDNNGKVGFRADGKRISNLKGEQTNPLAAVGSSGAIAIWKTDISAGKQSLSAQKVETNGFLYWGENGLEVFSGENDIINYNIAVDKDGLAFVGFIEKGLNSPSIFSIKVQRLSLTGYTEFPSDGIEITNSYNAKSQVSIVPDNNGGFSVFWLEFVNRRNVLLGAGFNSSGKIVWGPTEVSRYINNVMSFKILPLHKQATYLVWQNLDKPRSISHQIINEKGFPVWESGGKILTKLKGDNTNPQAIYSTDSSIIVSWTNDFNKDKNIFVQKFRVNGKPLWDENGEALMKIVGDQFGQTIVSDGKGGAITAWLDRRDSKMQPNIYGQKLGKRGELLWDKSGTLLAAYKNSEKSYLNLLSDQNGGAIAIFKDKRESVTSIFGQRIYASKAYTSLIMDFTAIQKGDSVQLRWRAMNNTNAAGYQIEKFYSSEEEDSAWINIGYVSHYAMSLTNRYQFSHMPDEAGSHYYRINMLDHAGNSYSSDIIRVNYIISEYEDIIVYQNTPNPFSDSTAIVFNLPNRRNVKLEIYNSRIEKITEFQISDTKSGNNRFVFDSRGLPNGVYFYRFTAGEFVDVKKMVIAK